jgi:RNA recognition motif-containing protein
MARRLYLGSERLNIFVHQHTAVDLYSTGLPPDARSDDVSKFFEGYGRIIDCRVMTGSSDKKDPNNTRLNKPSSGFGFIEFESSKAICHPLVFFYRSLTNCW